MDVWAHKKVGIRQNRRMDKGGCREKRQVQTERVAKSTDGLMKGWHKPKSSDSRCGIRQNRRVGKKGTAGQNFYYPFKNTKIQNELDRALGKFPAGKFPAKNLPKYLPVLFLRFSYTCSVLLSNTDKNDLARTADQTA